MKTLAVLSCCAALASPLYAGEPFFQKGVNFTAETALRLGRYFGTSPQFWMNLQTKYDLDSAQDAVAEQIEREVIPQNAA